MSNVQFWFVLSVVALVSAVTSYLTPAVPLQLRQAQRTLQVVTFIFAVAVALLSVLYLARYGTIDALIIAGVWSVTACLRGATVVRNEV